MMDCIAWYGRMSDNGYGRVYRDNSKGLYAHRLVFEECYGWLPEGMQVHHVCENRACVNPDHLEAVTHWEHSQLHRSVVTHCPQGHAYAEDNIYWRKNGARQCRTCVMARMRRNRERRLMA